MVAADAPLHREHRSRRLERSPAGYRLFGAAELQRLRTLRELLNDHDVALGEVGFALRLRTEATLSDAVNAWLQARPVRPRRHHRRRLAQTRTGQAHAPARAGHEEVFYQMRALLPTRRPDGERMTTSAPPTVTDFKVADLSLAEFGRKEIRLAEHEMPGLMGIRAEYADAAAAEGRADHRLAPHDDPDRGADRDARRARRRGPLGLVQHLLHPGPRRRRDRRRPRRHPEEPRGVPVFAWKGETLEEYWWCTEQARALARRRART